VLFAVGTVRVDTGDFGTRARHPPHERVLNSKVCCCAVDPPRVTEQTDAKEIALIHL